MNKTCLYLGFLCLGIILGSGKENEVMNLITLLAFAGAITPLVQELMQTEEEQEKYNYRR
ncbi:hypothetical protein [Veillonella sp. CHU110]|uniref:hypothetical protein n=1 Tax=Veillonella sp. CHU110 TaxID=2490947 RepID=UPI000F8EAC06|nr:hypothetical protein [Veillonella sp. CHU110]